jgi:2-(1,2-epoxy-1,2-dihydrophenyl)acetyl-CoA isomerase
MSKSTIELTIEHGIARVTLDRPEAANAMNLELARALYEAALRCDEDPAVRVVVLGARGAMFCAGGDLKAFGARGDDLPRYLKEVTTYLHKAVSHLTRMDAPLIAAVHGTAAGGGMSLACAADLVLAAASAKFTMAYTRAGLTPDVSSTYFLTRVAGLRRAMELMLTNRILTADEACGLGIVTRVVPDAALGAEVDALAAELAAGPTAAFGAAKRLLHAGWSAALEAQMELEARAIADVARGPDAREGIAAFLAKRPPRYVGR